MPLSARRLVTSMLMLGGLVSARESVLPDVHFDKTSDAPSVMSPIAASSTDVPLIDAAGHGHQHACHCAHVHIPGLPAEGGLPAVAPAVAGRPMTYIPEDGILSSAPPHEPPRA